MIITTEQFILRKPEPFDVDLLYSFKNDSEIFSMLGGFHSGYSFSDISNWIKNHSVAQNEVLWIIADPHDNSCLGHVGLYNIDFRVRSAEFGLLIGNKKKWGMGLGTHVSSSVIQYGFYQLNLNRISLNVLKSNTRACKLYEKLGFILEGTLRSAQFKNGSFIDVCCYSILSSQYCDV